jgi:DNA-directed RNA polymerase specialized sigma24 family protein
MEAALDAKERAALWLRAEEGMSVDDITRMLRVDGASGARGLLQTARRKLRAVLDSADPGDGP